MKLRYKVGFGVATGAAVLGMAGGAFAYFTGSGAGTGTASVGGTATWHVAKSGTSGTMFPGAGTSTVTFTVTNNGTGYEGIDSASQVTPTINTVGGNGTNAGDVTSDSADVPGCLASWFTPSLGTASPAYGTSVAPTTGTYSIPVNVTMSNAVDGSGNGINQDACKGAAPDVTLTVLNSAGH